MALRGVGIVVWFCRVAAGPIGVRLRPQKSINMEGGGVRRIPDCKVTTNKRKHQNKFARTPYFAVGASGGGERGFPGARNGERE